MARLPCIELFAVSNQANRPLVFRRSSICFHWRLSSTFSAVWLRVRSIDNMLERSVPFYLEQLNMVTDISRTFGLGTNVFGLGCSTATMLIGMRQKLPDSARLWGYDNSPPMLDRARQKIAEKELPGQYRGPTQRPNQRIALGPSSADRQRSDDMLDAQFIRPLGRDILIRHIYDSLANEGALIVTEKILTNNGHVNRFFIDFYYDFKRKQGYSDPEITRKREALENVLIPYQLKENLDLFRRNGFEIVETFFQWFNFAGFLCVKKPTRP